MPYDLPEKSGPEFLAAAWIKAATEFADFWPLAFELSASGDGAGPDLHLAALKMCQTLVTVLNVPGEAESAGKGATVLPEIFLQIAPAWWGGFFYLYHQWLGGQGRGGAGNAANSFSGLDQNAIRSWLEGFAQELQPAAAPFPAGQDRAYQEKLSLLADRLSLFQDAMAGLLALLYRPVEQSLMVMEEMLAEIVREGALPPPFKNYCRTWLKTMEGQYMTLMQSPTYIRAMNHTLQALTGFLLARQEVWLEGRRGLSAPSTGELDEVYRELYLLKKKVKELERQRNRTSAKERRE